jgi:hypothetical protein
MLWGCLIVIVIVGLVAAVGLPASFFTKLLEPSYPQDEVSPIGLALAIALWVAVGFALHRSGFLGWVGDRLNAMPTPEEAERSRLRSELQSVTGQRPKVLVRTYDTGFGAAEEHGRKQYEREAQELASLGYEPVHSAAAQKASWMGASVGKLTVTYRLSELGAPTATLRPPSNEPGTKVCPDCAETVQAAARVCRYCRHDFSS